MSKKRTINIYSVPSHQTKERTSGVDFARIIQPMTHLNGYEDDDVKFEVEVFDIHKGARWDEIAKRVDIIYFNYTANPWGFAAMGAMARKNGVKMVLDVDDFLFAVQKDNPSYTVYYPGSEHLKNFRAICNEVDYITVTTQYLQNAMVGETKKTHDQIGVLPNYIDLDLYKYRPKFKDDEHIQLLHFGSTTHFLDLANKEFEAGVDRIMKRYPNVKLKTVGAFMGTYRKKWGARYEQGFGDHDVYTWIKTMFEGFMSESDILVVPLANNQYTKGKSNIKWLEASSAKLPGVWQDITQYNKSIQDGKTGFIAKNANQWEKSIKKLIENPELRKKMGENAFKEVKENWTIQGNIGKYADFFKQVVDKTK